MSASDRQHAVNLVRLGMDVIADPVSGPTGADIVSQLGRLRSTLDRQLFDRTVATLVLIAANLAQDHPDTEVRLDEWINHPLLGGATP